MKPLRLPVAGCLMAAAALSAADGLPSWLNKQVFDRIQVSGRRVLGYHMQQVEGDREAFKNLTYYGRGGERFSNTGVIHIGGRDVLGLFTFDMQLTDDRYADPETRRMTVEYKKGPVQVAMGDIRGSMLNTNSFAGFNRSLKGVSAAYRSGRFAFRGVRSEAKGNAATITFQGDNSVGPYFLGSGRIAQDSVEVRVDGREMALLQDYTVNYDAGTITFANRIIPPTSTIVVAYESLGTGMGTGSIEGYSANYELGKFGRIGFSTIQQDPPGKAGLSSRTDLFQGFGDPSVPYILTFEPLRTRPVVVKLQGIIQAEGVHYRFDAENPAVFYFLFPVPATSNVDVTYTPKPSQTIDGSRKVVGFDYRLPFGPTGDEGSISYSQATGSLSNDVNPMKGTARGISATYSFSGLNLRASWRDIPNTFVGIESRGFLRNERSTDIGLDGGAGKWRYGLSNSNSVIGSRKTAADGTYSFDNHRATRTSAHLTYSPGASGSWSIERNRIAGRTSLGESQFDSTAVSGSLKSGRLQTTLGFDQTTGSGPMNLGTGAVQRSVALETMRMSATYFAGPEWQLGAKASTSKVSANGEDGQGSDFAISASYRPSDRLNVQLGRSRSDSGELASLAGFQNGLGLGYNGNGFTGGQSSVGFAPGGGTSYEATTLAVSYRPSDRISLAVRASEVMAAGSVSSNSDSRSYGLDVDLDLGKTHRLGLSYSKGSTQFLQSVNRSESESIAFYLYGSPNRWSYRLGGHMLLAGGGQFAQDSYGLDGSLSYRIDPRQRAGLSFFTGNATGYLPQRSFDLGVFYEHQLWENISLVTSYRWRQVRNLDPNERSGEYASRGLDIQLAFDFVP